MEELIEVNPEALTADGFDDAYVGWIDRRWTTSQSGPVAVYSRQKCIDILMKQGMSYEDAVDYFEFNVIGAYMGPLTPLFLNEATETMDG
jgi:hypothetical protein